MSFLELLGMGRKNGARGGTPRNKRVYIVDGALLDSSKGDRPRLSPRQKIDMLRRLARFAKKEGIRLSVVFDGAPLHDAPDGASYQEVAVHYAEQAGGVPELVGRLSSVRRGERALVITTCRDVEQEAQRRGVEVMNGSTFRKALQESGEGGNRPERGGAPSRRTPRKPARRGGRQGSGRREAKPASATDSAREGGKDYNPINDLIDVAD